MRAVRHLQKKTSSQQSEYPGKATEQSRAAVVDFFQPDEVMSICVGQARISDEFATPEADGTA